jgi:NAD(P)-dependent dehydrogenase (short-subunit alcohol dehydrogenase family)
MRFERKTAVVTGGASGIGKATVELLAAEGCRVYVLDINRLSSPCENIVSLPCDVGDYEQVKQAVAEVFKEAKKIDYLFSNAGIHLSGTIEDTNIEQIDRVIAVNIKGTLHLLKEILPKMRKMRSGNIVLMGSEQSLVGRSRSAVYGLTKGAIAQLAKSTAIDYAEFNIRVNCIAPGTVDTAIYRRILEKLCRTTETPEQDVTRQIVQEQLIRRIGTPEEIAKAVAFLLSDECGYITGSVFVCDGGFTCQ